VKYASDANNVPTEADKALNNAANRLVVVALVKDALVAKRLVEVALLIVALLEERLVIVEEAAVVVEKVVVAEKEAGEAVVRVPEM
jgi:hypothetical protein